MRFRSYLRLGATLSILCGGGNLSAQVFDLSGGASTLYGAQGASLVIHGSSTDTSIGAGLLGGHFAAGGATIRHIGGGTVVAGQQELSLDVPTDVFDTSHIFFGTGLGLYQSPEGAQSLNAFVGLSSAEAGTPLFQSDNIGKIAAFTQWKQGIGSTCHSVSTILFATTKSALESVQCPVGTKADIAITAGAGGGGRYEAVSTRIKQRRFDLRASYVDLGSSFQRGNNLYEPNPEPVHENVSAEYHLTRTTSLSGLHQNYITQFRATQIGPFTTSVNTNAALWSSLDEASFRYGRRNTGLSLSILHSTARQAATPNIAAYSGGNVALFAGLSHTLGRLQWTESFFHTVPQKGESSSILITGLSAAVNCHLRVTEAINVSGGGVTFSHGGGFVTRFSSFEVDYEMLYLANRPSNPFQQAMVFDTQLRLVRSVWLHAGSSISPTGRPLYTFRIGTVFSHNASSPEPISAVGLGINVLRGRVVDPAGLPIEGAAVMVGTSRLYTDTQGYFFFREKGARNHPFRVVVDEFVGIGIFTVVSAPNEVRTSTRLDAELIEVVVVRTPEARPPLAGTTANSLAEVQDHQ